MSHENPEKTRRVVVNLDEELAKRLRIEATIRDTSMTDIVAQAVSAWLDEHAHDPAEYFATSGGSDEAANG